KPRETKTIKQAVANLIRQQFVEVRTLSHATLASVRSVLHKSCDPRRPRPFHVLHIICHARYNSTTNESVLLFEDNQGTCAEVDCESFANIVAAYDPKLLFLSIRQSEQSSALDATRGLASVLLARGVLAVIGMQVGAQDRVTLQLFRNFYMGLAD